MLAVVITSLAIFPSAALLFFALGRMKRLKRVKIHAGVGKFITLSFEADADDSTPGEVLARHYGGPQP